MEQGELPQLEFMEPGGSPSNSKRQLPSTAHPERTANLAQDGVDDSLVLTLCREVLACLVNARAVDTSRIDIPIYIIHDSDLEEYDGLTHYDENGRPCRIGVRARCQDGQPYKRGAVVSTLLHEIAHVLDGYHHTARKAHSRSFYNHYARLVAAATKAGIFQLPAGMRALNHQTLNRVDNLSPISDLFDACLLLNQTTPASSGRDQEKGRVHVVLRHYKYGSTEKLASIDTKTFTNVLKAFKQKFPKHSTKMTTEYRVTTQDRETYFLDNNNLHNLRQGDTITCQQGP